MGARNEINASVINGVLMFAGLIALLTQSWRIFCVTAVALFVTSVVAGDIRFSSRR